MKYREIKFRAWVNKEEMVYLYNWGFEEEKAHIIFYSPIRMKGSVELMQYTGLTDKNGKEIYEGDIIFDEDGEYSKTIVITPYENYVGFFGKALEDNDTYTLEEIGDECEIIGNIYENPELIKS
jgi:uncharacterized phage protein (TIGR01671 family)